MEKILEYETEDNFSQPSLVEPLHAVSEPTETQIVLRQCRSRLMYAVRLEEIKRKTTTTTQCTCDIRDHWERVRPLRVRASLENGGAGGVHGPLPTADKSINEWTG